MTQIIDFFLELCTKYIYLIIHLYEFRMNQPQMIPPREIRTKVRYLKYLEKEKSRIHEGITWLCIILNIAIFFVHININQSIYNISLVFSFITLLMKLFTFTNLKDHRYYEWHKVNIQTRILFYLGLTGNFVSFVTLVVFLAVEIGEYEVWMGIGVTLLTLIHIFPFIIRAMCGIVSKYQSLIPLNAAEQLMARGMGLTIAPRHSPVIVSAPGSPRSDTSALPQSQYPPPYYHTTPVQSRTGTADINRKVSDMEKKCIICFHDLDDNDKKFLPCFHVYHAKCINDWLSRQRTCPTCTTPVPEEV